MGDDAEFVFHIKICIHSGIDLETCIKRGAQHCSAADFHRGLHMVSVPVCPSLTNIIYDSFLFFLLFLLSLVILHVLLTKVLVLVDIFFNEDMSLSVFIS